MRTNSVEEERPLKRRKRVSFRILLLTSVLSIFLGMIVTVGVLFVRLGTDGISLLQSMVVVRSRFVGPYEWNQVTNQTTNAMIGALEDRWSYFLTKEEYVQLQEARRNAYTGIGITISMEAADGIQILSVTKESPAEEAGLKAGDAIRSVEGVTVSEDTWQKCMELITGEEGTIVNLGIETSDGENLNIEVMRREILTIPVEHAMLPDHVGLIRLRNFYSGSADALIEGVDALVQDGAKSIIFDVRNNPGGYVTELTKMLDHLLPEGTIFYSQDIKGKETRYTSDEEQIDLPFAVLVNGDSYSAAEFLAAQLRETTGAAVVGEKTSGKGYAQQLFPLQNGSAIGLSTSRYFTGQGVSLIGVGLTPEPLVTLTEDEQLLLLQEKLSYENDAQLQAAIEALNLEK